MIWQGAFIDASKHWSARGAGFQGPQGDNVLTLPNGPSFARLAAESTSWPDRSQKPAGEAFRGYRLDPQGRPTFLYDLGAAPCRVEDFFEPVPSKETPSFRRRLTVTATGAEPPRDLWFRAAVADTIEPATNRGWFAVDGEWTLKLEADAAPVIRRSAGKVELLLPVPLQGNKTKIVQEIVW